MYKGSWKNTNREFYAVDLCGHLDSNDQDEQQTNEMVSKIKLVNYINAFFIVINSRKERFDSGLKEMFSLLFDIFGEHFSNNLGIIFTRWDFTQNKE